MFPGQIFSRALKVQSLLVGVQLFLRDRAGRREWQVGDSIWMKHGGCACKSGIMQVWKLEPTMTRGAKKTDVFAGRPPKGRQHPSKEQRLQTSKQNKKSKTRKTRSWKSLWRQTLDEHGGGGCGVLALVGNPHFLDRIFPNSPTFHEYRACRANFGGAGRLTWDMIKDASPRPFQVMWLAWTPLGYPELRFFL